MTEEKQEEDNSYKSLTLYILMININKAQNLVKADLIGSSDPFLVCTVNNQKYVTQVIKQNLNPIWNEKTTFSFVEALTEHLKFEVFDWDKGELGKHDAIGDCTLDVSNYFDSNSNGFDGDIELKNVSHGSINISVRGRMIKPYQLEERVKTLQEVTDKQKETIKEKNNTLSEAKESNEKHKQLQKTLDKSIEELEETKTLLEKDIKQSENNIEELKRAKEILQSQIDLAKKDINSLENNSNGKLKILNDKIQNKKQEIKKSKENNKEYRTEVARLKEEKNTYDNKIDDIKKGDKNIKGKPFVVSDSRSKTSKSSSDHDMRQPLLS